MGYDVERFVGGEIDGELICQICLSVLQNPVETPCEHFFCTTCINDWLSGNGTCPVDGQPLGTADLKTPGRMLRNFLARLEIKCDFQEQGCDVVVKLENLPRHLLQCIYNLSGRSPDALITCDQGCNLRIMRRDQAKGCFEHMSEEIRLQNMEIFKLRRDVQTLAQVRVVQQDTLDRIIGSQYSSQ